MLVVEYEGVETIEGYDFEGVDYEPDFYMSESLKKPSGLHDIEAFKGELLE